jgi:hypothetical protein
MEGDTSNTTVNPLARQEIATTQPDNPRPVPALWDRYAQSEEAIESGAWVDLGDGIRVKVRSVHSTRVRKKNAETLRKDRAKYAARGFVLDPAEQDAKEIADAVEVLVDWEGVTDAFGEVLVPSRENKEEIFKALPPFRRDVLAAAGMDETYRATALAGIAGNSRRPA